MIYVMLAEHDHVGRQEFVTVADSIEKAVEYWNASNVRADYGTMYVMNDGVKSHRVDYLPMKLTVDYVLKNIKVATY